MRVLQSTDEYVLRAHGDDDRAPAYGDIVRFDHITFPITAQAADTEPVSARFLRQALGASVDPQAKGRHLNIGQQQIHLLPRQKRNGMLHGRMIIYYSDLDAVRQRLESFSIDHEIIVSSDDAAKYYYICLTGPHGNRFECHPAPRGYCARSSIDDSALAAPLGLPIIESVVPMHTASGIARYFNHFFGARCQVASGVCIVATGPYERLIFRESTTASASTTTSGHHICLYIRHFKHRFDQFENADLLFDNPNYPEHCFSWDRASQLQQFRVLEMIDPQTNRVLFALEQEIRSLKHQSLSPSQ